MPSQESGNISLRDTLPSVKVSMSTPRAGEIGASPEASCDRKDGEISSFSASSFAFPRFSLMYSSSVIAINLANA